MRKVLAISLVLLVALVGAAAAREIERAVPMLLDEATTRGVLPGGVFGVSQGTDTFYYGGTVWDAVDLRWEAASPPSSGWLNRYMWTWSSAGYNGVVHSTQPMDGWKGIDNTTQDPIYSDVKDNATLGANCVIAGTKSLFFGATNTESAALCFSDQNGTGYGNNFVQAVHTPTYTWDLGDQITLSYSATRETEANFDFLYVILQRWDVVGGEFVDYDTMATYSGAGAVTPSFDIDARLSISFTPPVDFRILYYFIADGIASDGDGLQPTACGAAAVDSYVLNDNGTPYSEDFESTAIRALPAGWGHVQRACGDFVSVRWLASLIPSLTADPCVALVPGLCSMADSVLVLFDDSGAGKFHPDCQDSYGQSPVIDLSDHAGLPGRELNYERFMNLPLGNLIFMTWTAKYKPGCDAGGWSGPISDGYVYYSSEGVPRCAQTIFDVSTFIPPTATLVQIGLGVTNQCDENPWGTGCDQGSNATPYFDNVTFGVFGSLDAPYISMRELEYYQDQFAEDGTLNPTSTADTRTCNYLSDLVPPIFGDTLVCRGPAEDMEAYLCFRLAAVANDQPLTDPFFSAWFPGVQNGGWFSARMDTTEVTDLTGAGTNLVTGLYMACFHESDPVYTGNGLTEGVEILPNNVLVPGTRVEYYLKARYTGSNLWYYLPQAGEQGPEEFEILPMFADDGNGSLEWPCLIFVDHFGQRGNGGVRNSVRTAAALNTAGYGFDMFNRLGPSSDLRNGIGRWQPNPGQSGGPGTPKYNAGPGATVNQFLAYSHAMINCGNIYAYSLYEADVTVLQSWLTVYTDVDHARFLWISGDAWARELHRRIPPTWTISGRAFLNNVMATTRASATTYQLLTNDFTYCRSINDLGGRIVGETTPYYLRQSGCPRQTAIIGVTAGSGGIAEERYDGPATNWTCVVSNIPAAGTYYRTFSEAIDWCSMRDGSAGPLTCGSDGLLAQWFSNVLGVNLANLQNQICGPGWLIDVKEPGVVPAVVTSLGQAFPNPMNPTATIKYTIGKPGKVQLRVFDVSGRVIRTLVDEAKTAGAYSVIWDGKNDGGDRVASGVFFYQLNAPGSELNKKIVILQ
jgi:hypothetical protein